MNIINEKYLKQFSPIPLNFNLAEVKNYIDIAQLIWLRPILGCDFMDELEQQVHDNQVTSANSTALIEAIYPFLAYATVYESLPFIWSNISEVGITLGHSENSDSITLKDLTYIQQHLRNQVEVRKDFLIKWLDAHYQSFPLYHTSNCGCTSCCNRRNKLNKPNPNFSIYTTRKPRTDLY